MANPLLTEDLKRAVATYPELTPRAALALVNAGLDRTALAAMTDEELYAIPRIGPMMVIRIRAMCSAAVPVPPERRRVMVNRLPYPTRRWTRSSSKE